IELDKIYRQQDDAFISILNNLRNSTITSADIETLNSCYHTAEQIEELREVITLTTHNYKADQLNRQALDNLKTKAHYFEAVLDGEFQE
ncbi:MAG TPA: helicase, partial [Cyclobacteriaceae bacterium]|nr:helicase [Cyclobacteriaceae bacterium]